MKIIVDNKIPYINGVFEPYFEVDYISGAEISNSLIRGCDAAVVRTRTRCDRSLLSMSNIKIIASATIGLDHIDLEYCKANNIEVRNAAGCNATAVVQYVLAVMAAEKLSPLNSTIGIIGYGNIGSLLSKKCDEYGFKVLAYDPFKSGSSHLVSSLEQLLKECDLVTMHVPLTKIGEHKTENMADSLFFDSLKAGAIFVNSSRGEVVSESALTQAIENGNLKSVAIDVWHNEPNINPILLEKVTFATTHIAGYSKRGKERASEMAVRAIGEKFDIEQLKSWSILAQEKMPKIGWDELKGRMIKYFDILSESERLKRDISSFEKIRENYNYREEFF